MMTKFLTLFHKFIAIPIKIATAFCQKLMKESWNPYGNAKDKESLKEILKKKWSQRTHTSWFQNFLWSCNNQMMCYLPKNSVNTCQRMNLEPCFTPYTKISPKWVKDTRAKTIKFLEGGIGRHLYDLGYCSGFFIAPLKHK